MRYVSAWVFNIFDRSITDALFPRYLTKISDQIICLMSPTQSQAFVWDHEEKEEEADTGLEYADDDNEDRLFTFEITKTNEQEESVVSRPGFQVCMSRCFVALD